MTTCEETQKVAPLTVTDGSTSLTFEVDATYHTVVATLTYVFPGDHGRLVVPLLFEEQAVEQLYRLSRTWVSHLLDDARADKQNERDELLPTVQEIRDEEVPPPALSPLILAHTGRKKVVDDRAGQLDWVYVTGVVVHRTECPKVRQHVTDLRNIPEWKRKDGKAGLDGRFADWQEILPQVREGHLHVSLCVGCKPLGKYTAAVNARTSYNVATHPPEEMPWEFPGIYRDSLDHYQRLSVWHQLTQMTSARWEALADLIGWCAEQVDDTPVLEPPVAVEQQ